MEIDKYQFYIISYPADYLSFMFHDLTKLNNVEYIIDLNSFYLHSNLTRFLYRIHTNGRINRFIKLPFRNYWRKFLYSDEQYPGRQPVFIFLMRWLKPTNNYLFELLKRRIPSAKIVIYFEDLVATGLNSLDYSIIDKYADLVISYDKNDAIKYGYEYYPSFMSNIVESAQSTLENSNICFYGTDKGRGTEICQIYNHCIQNGYNCDFGIYKSQHRKLNGIKYLRRMMPYGSYIKHINKSDFILEIMQERAMGYTLRCWEAIILNKKLLTNNTAVVSAPFYDPAQFGVFEDASEIPLLMQKMTAPIKKNPYLNKIAPINFLDFIISKIQ